MAYSAVVPYECDSCDGAATFGESIFDGRLHWSLSHRCPTGSVEACGRDESPAELRAALLEQCGAYRLRAGAANRVAVMRVLRKRLGTPLAGVPALVELLQGDGLTGTEMELRLLAAQLAEAGVTTSVEADQAGDITS
jgi:hypothetical protein